VWSSARGEMAGKASTLPNVFENGPADAAGEANKA
jgi:hypothetical protein